MFGVVIIGRNEGNRLKVCLQSVLAVPLLDPRHVVYVDSGSTDDSVAFATGLGVTVLNLDPKPYFTAAKARNCGFWHLRQVAPELAYVQFIDGDCELHASWIPQALAFLEKHPEAVVVCGRRRERFPEHSIFNQLCDAEWDTPIGQTNACGGDALMRMQAVHTIGAYREDLIAGEEPELCVRLRQAGGQIWRLDIEMSLHDAAMLHWWQWYKRNMRAGYAFAQGRSLHGAPPERHWVRECRSAWFWGLGLPISLLLLGIVQPILLLLWLIYPAQVMRLSASLKGARWQRLMRALFLVMGKFPEVVGVMKFTVDHWAGQKTRLIEYK